MSGSVLIVTTPERAAALRRYLGPNYLGHSPLEELVRALLADVDRALEPEMRQVVSEHFSS